MECNGRVILRTWIVVCGVGLFATLALAQQFPQPGRGSTERTQHTPRLVAAIGHSAIHSAAISFDNSYVVSGGGGQEAVLWEVETGRELRRFTGFSQEVHVAFSPVANVLAIVDAWGRMVIHDVSSGTSLRRESPALSTYSLTFSEDGAYVVVGGLGTVAMIATTTGEEVTTLKIAPDGVPLAEYHQIADISPDNNWIVTGSKSTPELSVWALKSGTRARPLVGPTRGISSLDFSPSGDLVVAASFDGTAYVWDVASGRLQTRLTHFESAASRDTDLLEAWQGGDIPLKAAFLRSQPAEVVTTLLFDRAARVWDASSGAEGPIVLRSYGMLWAEVRFSLDGSILLAAENTPHPDIYLFDAGDWKSDSPQRPRSSRSRIHRRAIDDSEQPIQTVLSS